MSNQTKLTAYWRRQINKSSGLNDYGLQIKLKKVYQQDKWTVFVQDIDKGRNIASAVFGDDTAHNLVCEISNWIMFSVYDEIIKPKGKFKHFYKRKYRYGTAS